jgi:hypothetical protein
MPSTGITPQSIKPNYGTARKAMAKTPTPKLQGKQIIQGRGGESEQEPSSNPGLPSYSGPQPSQMSPGSHSPPPLAEISLPSKGRSQPTEPGVGAYEIVDPRKTQSQSNGNQVESARRFYR